ncbi:MAG: ABC transporter ATP-binding protein [Akkermansiaceae bacterium]
MKQSSLRRYYPLLWEAKWTFGGGILAGIIYGLASGLGLPTMVKYVFPILFRDSKGMKEVPSWLLQCKEQYLQNSVEAMTLLVCAFIPLIFLIRGLSAFLNTYWINKTGYQVLEQVRTMAFAKLQRLPMSYFHGQKSGDLLSRLTYDAEVIRNAIAQGSNDLIKQPATLIAAITYLISAALKQDSMAIAMIGLFSIPLCVLPISRAGKRIGRRSAAVQRQMGETSSIINETLQSPLEVRVYQLEKRQQENYGGQIRQVLRLLLKVVKYKALISPAIEVVASVGFAWALYLGVQRGMSLEQFMSVGTALFMAYEPVKKLGALNALLRQGGAAADRLEMIMQAEETVQEPAVDQVRARGKIEGKVEWCGVSFAYDDEPVLRNVSLAVPQGEMVALVGPSGSGKTTMVNLLPRLFDPQHGTVKIDDCDLRQWSLRDLRRNIAVVPQMPVLFQASILENILVGREGATEAEAVAAAQKAHAHEFIERLPDGYRTVVGERGSSLSGGQRQRIAMARAFLKDAPILILDEATSALDAESEAAVSASLQSLCRGRTTFIIAHRFSTIRMAGRIIVLERGELVADGTFAELQSQPGTFRKLLEAAGEA